MMSLVWATLRWILSLGGKFARVVPLHAMMIVCLTLVSQAASLLATFLPLKVVILLGSERIPRYFPASWAALDKDVLIGILSLGTLGVYLLHLLAERLTRTMTASGAARLLLRSHKMALFENQSEVAQDAYMRFSRALAGGVFVGLALLGLAAFYPTMAAVHLAYMLAAGLLLWLLHAFSESFRQNLDANLVKVLALVSGIGFFVSFGYLVADFILWTPPNVIVGIVALLLSRQVMTRMAGMIGDFASLQRQRGKLDALFFHGKVLMPALPSEQGSLWELLEPARREQWLVPLLREFTAYKGGALACRWHQLAVPNTAALQVTAQEGDYLVKLFDTNRSALAMHEATLLTAGVTGLPALPLLGATQVKSFHCLILGFVQGESPDLMVAKQLFVPIMGQLISARPTSDIVQRYQRSRPMLWQRLHRPMLERLKLAVDGFTQQHCFERLLTSLPSLQEQLQSLPLCIYAPDTSSNDIHALDAGGDSLLLNWSRWCLEPVGAGWPVRAGVFEQLGPALSAACARRSDLATVTVAQAELAALSFALDSNCQRQRFADALELLPALLERLDAVAKPELSAV